MANQAREIRFEATPAAGDVTALYLRPRGATHVYVLAHGAGAGMRHRFMEAMATELADRKIATFRYQFPYMEHGKRAPSPRKVLLGTVRSAVVAAGKTARGLPLVAGGKSMGGRMTSLAASQEALPGVRGLVFLGFPLHPVGKPGTERGDHLAQVTVPMLFVQGTRDKLAEMDLLQPVVSGLGRKGRMHVVDDGDHSFHVRKSSGRDDDMAITEVADTVAAWIRKR